MLVVLAFENAFVLALRTSHLITAAKIGCTLREIAKQRYELFAVRTNGADIPHSSSERCGEHWGLLSIGSRAGGVEVGKPFDPHSTAMCLMLDQDAENASQKQDKIKFKNSPFCALLDMYEMGIFLIEKIY
jgi:hypothetical protein